MNRIFSYTSLLITALFLIPFISLFSNIFVGTGETWSHLVDTVLANYIWNSVFLLVFVGIGVFLLGSISAWLICMYEFPGRRFFEWALILPLAVPAYVMAYTYSDLLQFVGPVQSFIRDLTDWQYGDYWFPAIRSLEGAIFVFIFVFYPYVYLLARSAFYEQSVCVLEASKTLNTKLRDQFFLIALPMARPALAAGTALALMETLADFGAVSYFGVQTFTTGIYRAWYSLGDAPAAANLSLSLLGFIGLLICIEYYSRKQAKFHQTTCRYREIRKHNLHPMLKLCAFGFCLMPILFGFLIPVADLVYFLIDGWEELYFNKFFSISWNSFLLSSVTAFVATVISLFLAYTIRLKKNRFTTFTIRLAGMGYAVPGTIIAVGTLIPFAFFDNQIDHFFRTHFNTSTGLLLTGSMLILIYAYLIRFLTVSLQTIDSSLQKVKQNIDDAAKSLGASDFKLTTYIHIPMTKASLLTAFIIVFVEVMKELPATLLLRPFNFDTLAIRAYQLASDERLTEAALPSLAIVCIGCLPVYILTKAIARSRPGS